MKTLHPLLPSDFVYNLDFLIDEVKADMAFKELNEETSPKIYQGLSMIYFFSLGARIHESGKLRTVFGNDLDMLYQLDQQGGVSPKPKNRNELKEMFGKLFEKTSDYLRKSD